MISKTQSESTAGNSRYQLNSGTKEFIDVVFPFVDQMNTISRLPKILNYIVMMLLYAQQLLVSFWPEKKRYSGLTGVDYYVFSWLYKIFWFIDITDSKSLLLIDFLISLFFTVFTICWISFELLYYHSKRSYIRWTLFFSKFVLESILPLIILPTAAMVGVAFLAIMSENNATNWCSFIFGIIFYVILLTVFTINMSLNSRSVVLTRSTFNIWDYRPICIGTIINSSFLVLSCILSIFPDWMELIVQTCHAICIFFVFMIDTNLPFFQLVDSILLGALLLSEIVNDIAVFIFHFLTNVPFYVVLIIGVAGFILSFVISSIIGKKVTKGIVDKLNETVSDEVAHYREMGMTENNEGECLKCLRIAMVNMCKCYYEMGLINYLSKVMQTNYGLCSVMQATAFIPEEIRKLNLMYKHIVTKRGLSFQDRFMIYQINRIKALRSSSSSTEIDEKLTELKTIDNDCESHLRAFWNLPNPSISYLEERAREINNAELQWTETLDHFPSNAKITYEYSRFLSETTTNLDQAVFQWNKASIIETGKNFAIDWSFRSFVRMFPNYLLNNIFNIKGKRITTTGKDNHSVTDSSSYSNVAESDGTTIDVELEETIGKKIFMWSRMRLSLHRSIQFRTSNLKIYFRLLSFLTLFISIFTFVFLYVQMVNEFSVRRDSILDLQSVLNVRFYNGLALNMVTVMWGQENGYYDTTDVDIGSHSASKTNDFADTSIPPITRVMNYLEIAREELKTLINSLRAQASEGKNVYELASALLKQEIEEIFCHNAEESTHYLITFKDKLIYMNYLVGSLVAVQDNDIYNNNDYCEVMTNSYGFGTECRLLFTSFNEEQQKDGERVEELINMYEIIFAIVLAVVSFCPCAIVGILYFREVNKLLKVLADLPQEAKETAKKPLRVDIDGSQQVAVDEHSKPSSALPLYLVGFIITVFIVAMLIIYCQIMRSTNADILKLNQWYVYAVRRLSSMGELSNKLMQIIILDPINNFSPKFTSQKKYIELALEDLSIIEENNNNLLQGSDVVEPCYGYDSVLDNYHHAPTCSNTLEDKNVTIHESYRCASSNQQLVVFENIAANIIKNPSQFGGKVDSDMAVNSNHILTGHLMNTYLAACKRFVELVQIAYNKMVTAAILCTVFGILGGVVFIIFINWFATNIDSTYAVLMSLLKHLSPFDIVSSKEIMNFLLHRKSREEDKSMGVDKTIIYNSCDAIICTSLNGIIEVVNPSVSAVLGYSPDQLLGQSITSFFRNDSSEAVAAKLDLMIKGQNALIYEDHFIGISDSASEICFKTTIIGMTNEISKDVNSFVFILSDETEIIKEQKEAEEAKAKSEKLLYQILPKDIVIRLNRGEKDISFSIPHASVIFLDIVKFSDYSASLTPQEIMGNLSLVFAGFDECISKFSKLTKIKLIGDVYMAAGGLFGEPDDPPNGHAEETVKFGLDCLTELDSINISLNASLELRVGVNTGGPLIAGVLGTEKPAFDIIGDPINVASRLQSTDLPGRVQISQATKDLIESSGFAIEERGEVFLKGKGKQRTFLVLPQASFFASITNSVPTVPTVPRE